jgi:hypothetical protein
MKNRIFSILLFSILLASTFLALFTGHVSAASLSIAKPPTPKPLTPTSISLSNINVQDLGTPFNITGTLTAEGKPVANTSVVITLDGKYLGQTSTNENGQFLYNVHLDLTAGSYVISANYNGSHLLAVANASAVLQIRPAQLVVQAIPAIAGISFLIDGHQFKSGTDGLAKIFITKPGVYHLVVQTDQYSNPTQRITFGRWQDENFQPSRDIQIPANGPLQVGFDVYHQIDQTFVDLDGNPVDPKRVTGITIKSAQGDIFNYQEGEHIWVPASRINRRSTGLEVTQLLYSVINVTVDGSNVVNKAQQRFYTGTDNTWKFTLTLYSIQVSAKDALFGSPVGEAVTLFYPNGKEDRFSLDQAGVAKLPSLARGIYKIQLEGTSGVNALTPVALSRNQVINENVITFRDLGLVFGFAILIALGLIFLGRPWLLFPHMRRLDLKPTMVNEEEAMYIHDN